MKIKGQLLLFSILLLSCTGDPEHVEPVSREVGVALPGQAHEVGQSSAAEPDAPIQERLHQAVMQAHATHQELLAFINAMFNDGLRQARSVICSGARIWALRNRELDWDEIQQFDEQLSRVLSTQRFVLISTYNSAEHIQIPLAVAYGGREAYTTRSGRSFGDCAQHYKSPIPNGDEAREIEFRAFAEEVVRARRRLEIYEAKLPIIEANMSRALAFEATLIKMKEDLEFDLLDPTVAATSMREYDEFLNSTVDTLNAARREVAVEPLVRGVEIDDVLNIMTNQPGNQEER